eukprot:403359771
MESDRRTDIYPPSLPSNLKKDKIDDIQFNSIGFYADLLNRLNDQIKTVQEVHNHSQYRLNQFQRQQ